MFLERNGVHAFTIAKIDVSFAGSYFFFMGFILVLNAIEGSILSGIIFALALTLSVLIHEFGHAVVCKYQSLQPSILLHGFGGLCFHKPALSDWRDIAIVVAGPVIEILFGIAALFLEPFVTVPILKEFVFVFGWVSIIWGAANLLLPMYPLDGGRLFLLILRRFMKEDKAQNITIKVSIGISVIGVVLAISFSQFFLALIAFMIFMENYNALQSGMKLIDRKAKVRASNTVKETLAEAKARLAEEDWREAARLCHVLRSFNDPIPNKMMDEIWLILGECSVRQGDYEEALGWLKRAPEGRKTRALIEEAESHLD